MNKHKCLALAFKRNEPTICPVCTENTLNYVGHSTDSDFTIHSWKCNSCNSAGDEVYVPAGISDDPDEQGNFIGHQDVHDKDGNEWVPGKEANDGNN